MPGGGLNELNYGYSPIMSVVSSPPSKQC